jgi:hypothetical protein
VGEPRPVRFARLPAGRAADILFIKRFIRARANIMRGVPRFDDRRNLRYGIGSATDIRDARLRAIEDGAS